MVAMIICYYRLKATQGDNSELHFEIQGGKIAEKVAIGREKRSKNVFQYFWSIAK